jgi:phenylacetate-coenzyme A ligase PaaK-like adenylate-forming protein
VKVKGMLINPDLIDEQLLPVSAVEEYQVVIRKDDPSDPYSMDQLLVRVAAQTSDRASLADEIRRRVRDAVQVTPRVEFVSRAEIYDPETAMKAVRIRDERPAAD